MPSSFYRILADPDKRNRWFLEEPLGESGTVIDAREFTQGIGDGGPTPLAVPIAKRGEIVFFNLAAFDMPVVSERIVRVVQKHSMKTQSFPVAVSEGETKFEILNVIARVRCIDESRSETVKWSPLDGYPEKIGQYRMISSLWIDSSLCRNEHVFRIEGWEIALIVSNDVKEAIESIGNSGIVYKPVSLI